MPLSTRNKSKSIHLWNHNTIFIFKIRLAMAISKHLMLYWNRIIK
ncbi:hypothetical protein vBEcoMWL3_gp110 [Escherichia phage vB_EcoM_WL-3]|nr:hypothetical protein vBEcoMWL3_gp110 [Escherichia phage vB_EcoM_WL-3]